MPANLQDFLQRFTGQQGTPNAGDAMDFFDRFASNQPQDREFDGEQMHAAAADHLNQLPEPQFHEAAANAYANASPQQQQGLVGTLMRVLQSRGINMQSLAGMFGGAVPSQFNPTQYAQLANLVRTRHPDAMKDVVREQPWLVKAMGNPIVMGALGVVASRMIKNRMGPPSTPRH